MIFDPNKMPRTLKRLSFLAVDLLLIPLGLLIAIELQGNSALGADQTTFSFFATMTIVGLAIVWIARLHLIKLHAFETNAVITIGAASAMLGVFAAAVSQLIGAELARGVPIIFAVVFFGVAVLYRIGLLHGLNYLRERDKARQNVLIYGAGAAGIQLASALRQSFEARPIAFVDDNRHLHGLLVAGLQVFNPRELPRLVEKHDAKRILLAIPSAAESRRAEILASLTQLRDVDVQMLPSFIDLMAKQGPADRLRTVAPDEVLGRDRVNLDTPEISTAYAGRNVLVTGAGGSIGAELCRQLVSCKPESITLFETSEYNLYEIDRTLRPVAKAAGVRVFSRLGSIVDRPRVEDVLSELGIDTVLHAAAYKHVPLVEKNELPAARNNVLGTRILADAAEAAGVERFILVSTDKAVRPTNVMGATKRMAEMVVQDMQTRNTKMKLAMVRFGNVLGSSGSVLPLFQQQIATGGPVTVTHPDVTRFFMTIPEAARLVLLAGAFAQGGDVFVLDMGEPKRILDIARRMISLSGRKVYDEATGRGDIRIKFTGLRPGEKLYEELLIDDETLVPTPHPKILRAHEDIPSQIEVARMLRDIQRAIDENDADLLRKLIATSVIGYRQPVVPGAPATLPDLS
jgi:FlaA1/EpsC-like NDP-sugar epimerase